MNRIALCGFVALCVGVADGALAAELPVWAAPVYQAPTAVPTTWTGAYGGFNAGWSWAGAHQDPVGVIGSFGRLSVKPDLELMASPIFGGQVGYAWQTGSWVWGIEGAWDGTTTRANRTASIPPTGTFVGGDSAIDAKQSWLASVSLRAGYTWGPGQAYFSLGEAWSKFSLEGSFFLNNGEFAEFATKSVKAGLVAGAGYEWMIAPNWSARAEFLYYNFARALQKSVILSPDNTNVNAVNTKFADSVVRIGLDYRFDWGGPIATRY